MNRKDAKRLEAALMNRALIKRKQKLDSLAKHIEENLIPAIAFLRKDKDTQVWVFNRRDGRTVCITTDLAHAAQTSMREGVPLEEAETALPIPLTIN